MDKQKYLQFKSDVSFTWDAMFRCYMVVGLTEEGKVFCRHIRKKFYPKSLVEDVYQYALNLQLAVERIDEEIFEA